jgi:hypothetical protein
LSPTAAKKEIELVLNIFKDNGHDKSNLIKLAKNYNPPSQYVNPIRPPPANQPAADPHHCSHALPLPPPPVVTLALMPVPPFPLSTTAPIQDDDENAPPSQDLTPEDTAKLQKHLSVSLPYVPHIAHQLKSTLAKAGVKTSFRAGMKLKDILCSAKKKKLPSTEKRGVYSLSCPCSPSSIYVGQTSRKITTRMKEHKCTSETGNFSHSGIS